MISVPLPLYLSHYSVNQNTVLYEAETIVCLQLNAMSVESDQVTGGLQTHAEHVSRAAESAASGSSSVDG